MKSQILLLLVAVSAVSGAQQQKAQPPPQFTDYTIPATSAPLPRAEIFGWVDVLVLLLVMSLGAWFVLNRRTRREVRVLSVFSVLYFGFYKLGCVCAVGSVQNVAYAATHSDYGLPLTVASFFALPLLFALFFGRVFCGSACPMGALQDLVLVKAKTVPGWLSGALGTLPYLYLGAAVAFAGLGTAFVVCEYDPFIAFFRLDGHVPMLVFGGGMLVLSTFVGRPYCRFICPYGVTLRWASVFAKHRVKVTPDECLTCHLCADACPYEAVVPPTGEPIDRDRERKRTAWGLVTLPTLILGLSLLGYAVAPQVALWDLRVRRAYELRQEQIDPKLEKTKATEAWARQGQPVEVAYAEAGAIERNTRWTMSALGAWFGLVIGLRMLLLNARRRRVEYEVDSASCVHCARCYAACPVPNRVRFAELKNVLEGRP